MKIVTQIFRISWLLVLVLGCGNLLHKKDENDDSPREDTPPEEQTAPTDPRLDQNALTDSTLLNLNQILQKINLPSGSNFRGQGIKIAVFDPGFSGLSASLGKRLPPHIAIQPFPKNKPADSLHGTKMLEVIHAVATGSVNYASGRAGPELFAFNTNGLTNFKAAIDQAIQLDVDIIVHAQIFEYGGNRDGEGFINTEVNRAIDAGILWINAVGNYAKSTYNAKVQIAATNKGAERELKLPYQGRYVRVRVPENKYGSLVPIKFSLGWDDFKDHMEYRTKEDLGLVVHSADGVEILRQDYAQAGDITDNAKQKGVVYSAHAREVIQDNLQPGEYLLRVICSGEQLRQNARLWIAADGYGVEVLDKGERQDSVFIPADNPRVLRIGASDVDFSSYREDVTGNYLAPDIQTLSKVIFDNGESYDGSSVAAAIAAGALAAQFSKVGRVLNKDEILAEIQKSNAAFASGVLPTISLFSLPKIPHLRF